MLERLLLPQITGMELTDVKYEEGQFIVDAHLASTTAQCPKCQAASRRIHSYYPRSIACKMTLDDAWDVDTARLLRLSSPYVVHLLTTRRRDIARAFEGTAGQVHLLTRSPSCSRYNRSSN